MYRKILLLLVSFLALPLAAQPETPLVWIERPETEQSVRINMTTFSVLRAHLQRPVTVIEANTARALQFLNEQPLACRGDLRKTEAREAQFAITRLPQVVYPSLRVFSHQPLAQSPVSLDYLKSLRQVLPLQIHRDYGFDTRLLEGDKLMVMEMQTRVGPQNAIRLFNHKRADLLIEYPSVYDVYSEQDENTALYVYPLAGQDEAALGYIMCSDTPEGRQMVERFDAILDDVRHQQAYLEAHKVWFPHFDITGLYNQVYQTAL
ncbi:hypothetical protein [Alteromonas sp. CYL-A6]|uniref:hypothetical protein n=1 Tax=Alteromonas nitratireducens TaxID=3390813 RepID=UPI0034AD43D7